MASHKKKPRFLREWIFGILLLVGAILAVGFGHWRSFIALVVTFIICYVPIWHAKWKLRRNMKELQRTLGEQGRSTLMPAPDKVIEMYDRCGKIMSEVRKAAKGKPCLRFEIDDNTKPSLCDSKLGGLPYWDSHLPYPTDEHGKPMAMVMQVNFDTLPTGDTPLPQTGMLQFFISSDEDLLGSDYGEDFEDNASQKNFRVVYHNYVNRNIRTGDVSHYPRIEALENSPVLGEYALKASAATSQMHNTDRRFNALFADAVKQVYGDDITPETYPEEYLSGILPEEQRWPNTDEAYIVSDHEAWLPAESLFQMGGYPAFVQSDFREAGSPYDTLLMQLPTIPSGDEALPWRTIWSDCGTAVLLISEADLRRRDFSRISYETQCY